MILDTISKILATENISVRRLNVRTASFNILDRVLTLPIWKNMTEAQEFMLIGHEVSHALYSTSALLDFAKSYKKPGFFQYINIVEDARIERLIKIRYPGLKSDFYQAYKEFYADDKFEIGARDVNAFPLIDRINIFFKIGSFILVEFTPEEQVLVDEVSKTQTEEEVFVVTKKIYELAQKQKEEKQIPKPTPKVENNKGQEQETEEESSDSEVAQEESSEQSEETSSDDQGEPEESGDESSDQSSDSDEPGKETESDKSSTDSDQSEESETAEESHDGNGTDAGQNSESDTVPDMPSTQEKFDQNLSESTVLNGNTITINIDSIEKPNILSTAQVYELVRQVSGNKQYMNRLQNERYKEFTDIWSNIQNTSNHMIREFEMRKAADQNKRTTIAKSGSLSMSKLSQYRVTDDIFKRFAIVPDSVNHGFIIVVDWSGSMRKQTPAMMQQIATLALFFIRTGIKFEVILFSDVKALLPKNFDVRAYEGELYQRGLSLLKILDHNSSVKQIKEVTTILSLPHYPGSKFSQDQTPLNPTLAYMLDYVPMFKAKNNIQKMNFISLTDGGDNSTNTKELNKYYNSYVYLKKTGVNATERITPFDEETITNFGNINNKQYTLPSGSTLLSQYLVHFMKKMTDVKTIGYFIVGKKKKTNVVDPRALTNAIVNTTFKKVSKYDIDEMRKNLIKNHFCEIQDTAYDKFYILFVPELLEDFDFEDIAVTQETTARQISKQMTILGGDSKKSRAFAQSLISFIA